MRNNHILIWVIVIALLTSCSRSPQQLTTSRPTIVVTFSILADITQQIGKDVVDVVSLVPADGDAHVYEPTPADGVRMHDAVAIVQLGLSFEPWFDELYNASGSNAAVIIASRDIATIEAHGDEHDTHADAGEVDPHVWHDVKRTIQIATNIRDGLIKIAPSQAATLNANAQVYIDKLRALDSEITTKVATIPEAQRVLVTNHDTFQYFASTYGFTVLGSALGSVSTESADPGAGKIAALADAIKASGVPAIFVENVANPKLIEQIAQTAGVKVAPPLYTDALSRTGDGITYIDMMRYNVDTIVNALTATTP